MSSTPPNDEQNAKVGPYYGYGYPADPDADGGFSIGDAIGIARRRWEIIAVSIAAGTVAATIWGFQQPVTYSATAKVLIESDRQVVDLGELVDDTSSDATSIETQLNLLKSSGFLEDFIKAERTAELAEADALRHLATMKEIVSNGDRASHALLTEDAQGPEVRDELESDISERAAAIAESLRVAQQGRSSIIDIVFTSTSPNEAAKVANELANFYIADQANRRKAITSDATGFLEQRLEDLEQELIASEEALHQYRATAPSGIGNRGSITEDRISEVTSLLIRTRAERREKEERLAYIRQLSDKGASLNSLTEVLNSPHIVSLWQNDAELRRKEAELRLELGANHPRSKALGEERSEIEERIEAETRRIIDNVANELQVLVRREHSLEEDLNQLSEVANDNETLSDRASIRLRLLEGQAESARRIYEDFLVRIKQTREQEAVVAANTRIVATAKTPTVPSSSSPIRIALLGFVASSFAGFGFAYLRDKTDQKLRIGKDVDKALNVPCLGSIPYLTDKDREHRRFHDYLRRKRASRYTEAMRSVYTQIMIGSEAANPPKVILITSSIPNEGKTTFATSFATMIGMDGKKALLLDLDFRNPSVLSALDLEDQDDKPSFEAFLSGKNSLDTSMIHKLRPGFHVLAMESATKDPGKLLRTSRLSKLIEAMRNSYDFIIVDGPPSLGLSDSKVLLSLIDSLVFIVRWNHTKTDIAVQAVEELTRSKANLAGAVLTQVNMKKLARYGPAGTTYYSSKETQNYYVD